MKITHINPDNLYKSPVFSQAVLAEGGKTLIASNRVWEMEAG